VVAVRFYLFVVVIVVAFCCSFKWNNIHIAAFGAIQERAKFEAIQERAR